VRNKDHKIIDILWSATYSEVEQSVFCVAHDITERKNAERLRQDLMQMVSHDLRTPLTTIKGMIDMFTEGLANSSSEKGKQLLGYADKSTFRMLTLINDLLDAERIESGMLELDKRDTELDGVFEQAIHTVLPLAEERRIKIAATPTSLRVFADGDRIVQVLINLLGNAIKFSGPNTTIRLETDIVDGAVEISVSDQGRGIPPERLDSVFDRFSQVEVADARDRSGSGLGLAICKALVDLHGGRITVKSKVGEGTTFSFTIPTFRA
jgi:signal transduction histidine kinase